MSDKVKVTSEVGIVTLTLARPEKKNALIGEMYEALTAALERAEADDTARVVLIQGEGGDFTAGNDITDFVAASSVGGEGALPKPVQAYLRTLNRFGKPLVAAVEGVAVGIGLTMLLHCDLVIVAEDAKLAAPFGALGLTPEAGASLLLPPIVGHPRAFALFALGQTITGAEAAQWGLANRAVPAAEVKSTALKMAQTLASRSPEAMKATKALMRRPQEVQERIELEIEEFATRLRSPEAAAAFAAFATRK